MSESYLGTSAVLEWRYSFSQAEMLLADNIPEQARTSYLALKAVVKTHINREYDDEGYPHKIPSYALKTILFFEVENLKEDYWTEEDVEHKFFWVLFQSLKEKVETKKCQHYWIETLDLFADMKDKDLEFMKEKLMKIEEQPVQHLTSEWLEWNRYIQMECPTSCIQPGINERYVHGRDFKPFCDVPCCIMNPFIARKRKENEETGIKYNQVAIEVY